MLLLIHWVIIFIVNMNYFSNLIIYLFVCFIIIYCFNFILLLIYNIFRNGDKFINDISLKQMPVEKRCKTNHHEFDSKKRFGTKTCIHCNKQIEFKRDGSQVCWRAGKYDFIEIN